MHMLQRLFYLTTALHVSGVTITHLKMGDSGARNMYSSCQIK